MRYVTGLCAVPAIAQGTIFRKFAPFALALLITAGAQAASVSSTLTLTGTTTITSNDTIFTNSGQVTLTNLGSGGGTLSGTFASTVNLQTPGVVTGSSVTAPFTITLSGGTLIGTYTEPFAILIGATGTAAATITGGTGSYAGYTGSFPSLPGSSSQSGNSGTTFTFTFTGTGTINTSPVPTIASVTDGASYTANVAQGSFFTVWGSNLAPSSSGLTNFPRPTSVGGVKVTFTPLTGGAGTDTYLIYVGTGQINALLPSTVPVGNYNVTVTNGGTVSFPVQTQVVASKVGLFTQDQSGTGLAVVFNFISQSESDVNRLTTGNYNGSLSSPAKPGQILIAWGTGIGPYQAGDNTAGISHDFSTSETITAIVGGVSIPVIFAGLNGYAGEDQINFTLPANVPTGCSVSLQISVNGVLSAATSIAIAPAGASACVQPGYTTQQLQLLDQGGTINTGSFSLSQLAINEPPYGTFTTASASGSFAQMTSFQLPSTSSAGVSVITSGSCLVIHVTSQGTTAAVTHVTKLDAGAITLNGPSGTNLNNQKMTEDASYDYTYLLSVPGQTSSASLLAGTYTLTGAGGTGVGSFNTSITLGSPLTLNNPATLPTTVTESAGLTLNWTGGNASDVVEIIGDSGTITGTGASQVTNITEFVCSTTAGQKTFTVPASILTQLPTITAAQVAANTATGFLEVVSGPPAVSFNPNLTKGGTIPSTLTSLIGIAGLALYQ
jgi:uncharacterized protein (TIGR03437 family)